MVEDLKYNLVGRSAEGGSTFYSQLPCVQPFKVLKITASDLSSTMWPKSLDPKAVKLMASQDVSLFFRNLLDVF